MKQHLQTLVNLLTKNDLKALLAHYIDSNEIENTEQLGFMFQQSEIKPSNFGYYQQLATGFIEAKGIAQPLLSKIKTNNTLSFFTPALQIKDNFKETDDQHRNVLHHLFTNNKVLSTNGQPPFNYLRSMMLFGSNFALRDALCQRDEQNLTPIEAYLFTNKNLAPIANHELTALLALIEIESNQQEVDKTNYFSFVHEVNKLCLGNAQSVNKELQRILLTATYYQVSIDTVIADINEAL